MKVNVMYIFGCAVVTIVSVLSLIGILFGGVWGFVLGAIVATAMYAIANRLEW